MEHHTDEAKMWSNQVKLNRHRGALNPSSRESLARQATGFTGQTGAPGAEFESSVNSSVKTAETPADSEMSETQSDSWNGSSRFSWMRGFYNPRR